MKGIEIKTIRNKIKKTQREFGEMLGVSMRTIQSWESGIRTIPQSAVILIQQLENSNENITEFSPEYIPLLPISAQGGSLNDFMVSVKDSDYEQIISPINGADFALTISGDSMSPEYSSGSQILVKKINEKAFIDWGKVYVLDTCNGTVIKKILPPDSEEFEGVKCVSINKDYPPFNVKFEDIYGVYRVMLCMSIK